MGMTMKATGSRMFPAERLKDARLLFRPVVAAAAAVLAGLGFVPVRQGLSPDLALTLAGVFLLVCGASACNQVQEQDQDALMRRTRNRPLPAGRMRPLTALCLAGAALAAGIALLCAAGGPRAGVAGFVPLILYNGLYTPLKRKSALNLPIGAVAGAAPIPLGAVAAGASPAEPVTLILFGIAVLWQMPHVWLRALRHKEDCLRAGFVVPFLCFSSGIDARAALLWPAALGASLPPALLLCLPLLHVPTVAFLGFIALGLAALPLLALRRAGLEPVAALRAADGAVCVALALLPVDILLKALHT